MPSFAPNNTNSNAMYAFQNANGRFNSSRPIANASVSNSDIGNSLTNQSSSSQKFEPHITTTASIPASSIMATTTMAPVGRKDNQPSNTSPSSSLYRRTSIPGFQDLIKKGRQAQADDERNVYETKKAKQESDRAKAARARLATDNAVRELAMESRSNIDTCKGKIIDEMEKNLRALLETDFRAEIREKVYEDEKIISATYAREIKDSTRQQLEHDLEPVIVAEMSAKFEEGVKQTLRAELEEGIQEELRTKHMNGIKEELRGELKDEIQEELRTKCRSEIKEELRDELEDIIRNELRDLYRDEVRLELKRELSPSVRAELVGSLGLQHTMPELEDLKNPQPTYPELRHMQHLSYSFGSQGYEDDEEEGEEILNDAPEQFGARDNNDTDREHFGNDPINGVTRPHPISDTVNNNIPDAEIDAERSRPGSESVGSRCLKRHIDENYDDYDDEEPSDVERPAEKKVKISAHYDLTASDDSSPVDNTINGDHRDEKAQNSEVQSGIRTENGDSSLIHGNADVQNDRNEFQKDRAFLLRHSNVKAHFNEEQLHSDQAKEADADFPLYNEVATFTAKISRDEEQLQNGTIQNNVTTNAYFDDERLENGRDRNDGNADASFEEEHLQNSSHEDVDGDFPPIGINLYANDNGNGKYTEHFTSERSENSELRYHADQSEVFRYEEYGNAEHQEQELDNNAFKREEVRDSGEELSGSDEEEYAGDGQDEEFDGEDNSENAEDEEEAVQNTGSAYRYAHEPFGNYFHGNQIDGLPSTVSRGMSQFHSEEEDDGEDYDDDHNLAYGRAQVPFDSPYPNYQINEASHVFSRGVKHSRSDEEGEEEDHESHNSKRFRGESYSGSEQSNSGSEESFSGSGEEVAENAMESESEGQDAQGRDINYGLIKETNTQDDPICLDSSDEEEASQPGDDEKTLVEDSDVPATKVQAYAEESLFVSNLD